MQMPRTKRIEQLERKRASLIKSIAGVREMIRGSFNTVYRKCGKPNCRCAKGVGHPSDQIVFLQGSRSKCRTVPKEEVPWVKSMTENRREFREKKRELKTIEKAIHDEINELEAEIINSSMEGKAWLK